MPVDALPLVAFAPLQPPEAVQLVASVEPQVSVDAAPLAIESGLALSATVGAGAGADVSEPPPQAASAALARAIRP